MLRQYLHIGEHRHEVRVSLPTGDDVEMHVVDHPGAGDAAEVPAGVVALRGVDPGERGHALLGESMGLERLGIRERAELPEMAVGGDEQMARGVRELVEEYERIPAAVYHQHLVV